jgi:predicted nucleotidyltransferase
MKPHGVALDSQEIQDFCRRWKIKGLSVFGSILRDDFGPESDVDFVVDYDEDADWDLFDAMSMQEELEAILGRSADLLDRKGIESSENRFLKHAILSTQVPVYGS